MKKAKIITAVLALLMITTFSCSDLEENPIGLLSPQGLFKTPDDLALAVDGGFSILAHENFYGRKLSLALLIRGDMCTYGDPATSNYRISCDGMDMQATNNVLVDTFWPRGYEIIATVNAAINGTANVQGSEEDINAVVAEGKFVRALVYFTFVRLFGEIPYVTEALDADGLYNMPESPVDVSYAGIIEDLQYAKQWLPDVPTSKSRPSKGTAAGLLASVYLTRATSSVSQGSDFQSAYNEAKYVIDNESTFGYKLEDNYADLFNPSKASSAELMLEIDMIGGDAAGNPSELGGQNPSNDQMGPITGPRGDQRFSFGEGWSACVPTNAVHDTWAGGDYRKAVSLDTVITYKGQENYFYTNWGTVSRNVPRAAIAKYFRAVGEGLGADGKVGSNGRDSNGKYIIMRYAEVLLTAAEALNEINSGPNAEAYGYINRVRERARKAAGAGSTAYPPSPVPANLSGLDKAGFLDAVLEERRLELAFEFGRWFDIQRRHLGPVAFGPNGLEQQPFDAGVDYLFPKYQVDVDLNPYLNQNTGY